MNSYQMVLHRPVETAGVIGKFNRRSASNGQLTEKFGALLWRVHSTGNLRCARGTLQTQEGWLDSHDRSPPGAIVPVQKPDFGCCGPLFGGEICALKRGRSRPRWKACVIIANRVEPSQFQ